MAVRFYSKITNKSKHKQQININELYFKAKNISPQVAAADFANLFEIMQAKFSSKNRPYLFGTDNALDLKWASEFIDELRGKNATLDGFNWHAYPLGAGAHSQVKILSI